MIVDESDDGITGGLLDWRCPRGAKPPPPGYLSPTTCTLVRGRGLDSTREIPPTTEAEFDQAPNRLTLHHDVSVFDFAGNRLGTVRIDLTMQGRGRPQTLTTTTNGFLDHWEMWNRGKAWGTVDGHRVAGHHTRQVFGGISSSVENWVRIQ